MGEDPGMELVKAAAAGGVQGFLETIAPGWVETGQWSADVIRRYRLKTQIKTLVAAKRMLEDAGISPSVVSYKTFVPLLEHAGLEDDPEEADDPEAAEAMQERWAALLANAASGDASPDVLPSFPGILAELTAREAAMLEILAALDGTTTVDGLWAGLGFEPPTLVNPPSREYERALVQVENLERLGLCSIERPNERLTAIAKLLTNASATARAQILMQHGTELEITRLGRAFVAACTPPGTVETMSPG